MVKAGGIKLLTIRSERIVLQYYGNNIIELS